MAGKRASPFSRPVCLIFGIVLLSVDSSALPLKTRVEELNQTERIF